MIELRLDICCYSYWIVIDFVLINDNWYWYELLISWLLDYNECIFDSIN
jgi:hypothetical protein